MKLDLVLGACEWYKLYSISVHHAMHAFISARQRTCPARIGFWVSVVCGSSGFCTGVLLSYICMYLLLNLTSTNIQALVHTLHRYPPTSIRRESFPARGSGCSQDYHPSQSCNPTSVMQHVPSAATHIIGVFFTVHSSSCSPSWLYIACIHQKTLCAQFCHGYYICSLRLIISRSITIPFLNHLVNYRAQEALWTGGYIYIILERKKTKKKN